MRKVLLFIPLLLSSCGTLSSNLPNPQYSTDLSPVDVIDGLSGEAILDAFNEFQEEISSNPKMSSIEQEFLMRSILIKKKSTHPEHRISPLSYSDILPISRDQLNSAEEALCNEYFVRCVGFLSSAQQAMIATARFVSAGFYTSDKVDNEADAFRHSLWNAYMARHIGPANAKLFADAHEVGHMGTSIGRDMDFFNNDIGRKVGSTWSSTARKTIEGMILDKMVLGELKIVSRSTPYESKPSGTSLVPSNKYNQTWNDDWLMTLGILFYW